MYIHIEYIEKRRKEYWQQGVYSTSSMYYKKIYRKGKEKYKVYNASLVYVCVCVCSPVYDR